MASSHHDIRKVYYRTVEINHLTLFYREAGSASAPTILLLHGFPSSSHQYRYLIPLLATYYHVIAPDYPGYGYSSAPSASQYSYTFEHLTDAIEELTEKLQLKNYLIYMHDFGGPVGFRLAMRHPEAIAGFVIQNANAYNEGLPNDFKSGDVAAYWANRTSQTEAKIRSGLSIASTKWQYLTGVEDSQTISPDSWTLDQAILDRVGSDQIFLDLMYDYRKNVAAYPEWQQWLREHKPKTLIVWASGDQIFSQEGAKAYLQDLPDAHLVFLNTGHFATENKSDDIAREITAYFNQK